MKRLLLVVFCLLPSVVSAQTARGLSPERGTVYAELFGNGMTWLGASVNVERMTGPRTAIRLGGGADLLTDGIPTVTGILMVNRLVGRDGHFLELGAGVARSNAGNLPDRHQRVGPSLAIGVRRVWGRGETFRLTFTPLLPPFAGRFKRGARFVPAVGLSRGFTF